MSNMFQNVSQCHQGQHDLANQTSGMYLGETYVLADGHSGKVKQYCITP